MYMDEKTSAYKIQMTSRTALPRDTHICHKVHLVPNADQVIGEIFRHLCSFWSLKWGDIFCDEYCLDSFDHHNTIRLKRRQADEVYDTNDGWNYTPASFRRYCGHPLGE